MDAPAPQGDESRNEESPGEATGPKENGPQ